MDDHTVTVTCSNQLSAIALDGASSLKGIHRWLGDPLETISIHGRGAAKVSPATRDVASYVPRTELGRKLWEIRKRIVAAGKATMTWEDIEREVAERRGGVGDLFE